MNNKESATNKRIDQISDQVMYEFKDAFSCSNDCGIIPDEFFERFAELIVRECIAHCTNLDSMQYIAQHFGVKVEGLDE